MHWVKRIHARPKWCSFTNAFHDVVEELQAKNQVKRCSAGSDKRWASTGLRPKKLIRLSVKNRSGAIPQKFDEAPIAKALILLAMMRSHHDSRIDSKWQYALHTTNLQMLEKGHQKQLWLVSLHWLEISWWLQCFCDGSRKVRSWFPEGVPRKGVEQALKTKVNSRVFSEISYVFA